MSGLNKARLYHIAQLLISISRDLVYSILISIPYAFCTLAAFLLFDAPPQNLDPPPASKSRAEHDDQVQALQKQLRRCYDRDEQVSILKKVGQGHSSRTNMYKHSHARLDFTRLNCLLDLDVVGQKAEVEAGVTFSSLCSATLKHNLLPPVVPEFRSITISGAISGLGIESTSLYNGTFDTHILDAILLTPLKQTTRKQDPELWASTVGSNGTVSLVTQATVALIPASKWVKLRYVWYEKPEGFAEFVLRNECKEKKSWFGDALCDAVVFGHGTVAMVGECVTEREEQAWKGARYRDHPGQPFFYQHVEEVSRKKTVESGEVIHEELMPTLEYLFRYDRGGFWGISALAFMLPPLRIMLSTPLFRPVTYALLTTEFLYKVAMLMSDSHREDIALLQDVTLPLSDKLQSFSDLLDWLDDLKPIWLCPVRVGDPHLRHKRLFALDGKGEQKVMMNIGAYGIPRSRAGKLAQVNKELEEKVITAGGHKALYAHVYASRAEFWSWYEAEQYETVRQKYGSDRTFLGLWEKVKR